MMKSKQMVEFLDGFALQTFGHTRSGAIEGKTCVCCGNSVGTFRDALSEKEYSISGMCQKCQDEVFGA